MNNKEKAELIFDQIEDTLAELWGKLTSGDYNLATQYAYQIAFVSNIEEALNKIDTQTEEGAK